MHACVCVGGGGGRRRDSVRVGEKGVRETDRRQADRWMDTHTIKFSFSTSATTV